MIKIIFIIYIIVQEYSFVKNAIKWSIIAFFIPFGFVLYLLFGNKLKIKSKGQIEKINNKIDKYYKQQISIYDNIKMQFISKNLTYTKKDKNTIINFAIKHCNSPLCLNNKIKTFVSGEDFLNNLIEKIDKSKHYIYMLFYIFSDDKTGKLVANHLIKKAKEGVKVIIIYDAYGSKKTRNNFWQKLRINNIDVFPFFPGNKISFFNFKINYRNHKKIVLIDDKVAYLGGVNIRNDHINIKTHLSPWRDTMIEVEGTAIFEIKKSFMIDYAICTKSCNVNINDISYSQNYVKNNKINSHCSYEIQIINSSPSDNNSNIHLIIIKLIKSAKKFIYIETPYFIVDNDILTALNEAKNRDVEINIIIPKKPDKKIVYSSTFFCIKNLIKNQVDFYLYKNFIHSKTIITDNAVIIGSANFDNRSMFLNFEIISLCCDKRFINQQIKIFNNDIYNSNKLTIKKYKNKRVNNFFFYCLYKLLYKFM